MSQSRPLARRGITALATALVTLQWVSQPVVAHETWSPVSEHGLGFGLVVFLTVAFGVLGGVVIARRTDYHLGRASALLVPALLVVLGCWAVAVALLAGPLSVAALVALGAVFTWRLRTRVVAGHRGCDQAALSAVVAHRFLEGALLATLYAASAAVGIGAAVLLALHTAAETGAVAGLWTGTGKWLVVAAVQTAFVVGAFGGGLLAGVVTPLLSNAIVALFGGVMIAAGLATATTDRHVHSEPA